MIVVWLYMIFIVTLMLICYLCIYLWFDPDTVFGVNGNVDKEYK